MEVVVTRGGSSLGLARLQSIHQQFAKEELWSPGAICQASVLMWIDGDRAALDRYVECDIRTWTCSGGTLSNAGISGQTLVYRLAILFMNWMLSLPRRTRIHVQHGLYAYGGVSVLHSLVQCYWVPIGWARISKLVQTVQVDGGWASQQLELMDDKDEDEDDESYQNVEEWLKNAQWLHITINLALRDESRLISERMKYLLYEVLVRVAGGLLFELLGQYAGDPFVDEDDILIVLRS
ncbi:hypothetical protein QYF36_010949 [Acer negundo]|nr:hypothetical protein QYF36_010949 [Acer negundo]